MVVDNDENKDGKFVFSGVLNLLLRSRLHLTSCLDKQSRWFFGHLFPRLEGTGIVVVARNVAMATWTSLIIRG